MTTTAPFDAVIEEAASTLIVGPSGRAQVAEDGNIVVDL